MQVSPVRAAKRRTLSTRWAITSLHLSMPWDYLRSMCSASPSEATLRRVWCFTIPISLGASCSPEPDRVMVNRRTIRVFRKLPAIPCRGAKIFCFSSSEASQAAGKAFWERRHQRKDADPPSSIQTMKAQQAALMEWREPRGERYADLKTIKQPTLVVNGNDDIMVPTINSFTLSQHIPNAQLIVYPASGHGALFQYPELFVAHTKLFLEA